MGKEVVSGIRCMLKSVSERPRLRPGNGRDELRRRDSLRRVRIIPRLSVVGHRGRSVGDGGGVCGGSYSPLDDRPSFPRARERFGDLQRGDPRFAFRECDENGDSRRSGRLHDFLHGDEFRIPGGIQIGRSELRLGSRSFPPVWCVATRSTTRSPCIHQTGR